MIDRALCVRAAQECACLNLRKASRVVTQMYDEALAGTGLRCTQLAILLAVKLLEPISPSKLAGELVMDRSTLTRNLQPLVRSDLLQIGPGADRRSRQVSLTETGGHVLEQNLHRWCDTQQHFVTHFGEERWQHMLGELAAVVDATHATQAEQTAEAASAPPPVPTPDRGQ